MTDLVILLVVVGLIATIALVLRRADGHARATEEIFPAGELAAVGATAGVAQLVVFTAPGCAPCAAARRVLDDVAMHYDAEVTAIDVTEHEQLARDKQVWRAPTVFVLDTSGRSLARISGVPRAQTLHEALTARPVRA